MNFVFSNGGIVDSLAKAEHVIVSACSSDQIVEEIYVTGIGQSGSALRATGDLLVHSQYDTPITQQGLHGYASKLTDGVTNPNATWSDLFGLYTKRVAVVSFNYGGELVNPADADLAKDGLGWVQVDLMGGYPMQTNFLDLRSEEEILQKLTPFNVLRGWKHGYIDALLRNYALKIRVLYGGKAANWRDTYAAKLIAQWTMEDKAAALELRNTAIQNRNEYVNVHRPVAREAKKLEQARANGTPAAAAANPDTGELVIMVSVYGFKKKQVNMFDLEPAGYSVANAGRILGSRPYEWNPTDPKTVDTWQSIAGKGLSIVLE